MKTIEIIEIVALIVNAIIMISGFLSIFESIRRSRRQAKLSFFERYTARYGHILEIMPEEFFQPYREDLPIDKYGDINRAIRLYLDLCSEEYYLYTERYLDEKVWKEWKGGIEYYFENQYFYTYWEERSKDYESSYKAFFNFINDQILKNPTNNI